MLRLELLFDRLGQLVARDTPLDHHFALVTLFEIVEVAARADLKSDVLKELDRHRSRLQGYRGHPGVSEAALEATIGRIEHAHDGLALAQGKTGAALAANDWLMSIRSRVVIPGGTCEFDLPGYHAWQQHRPPRRRADLQGWMASLLPLAEALHVLLGLLRDSGAPQRVLAAAGHYQQSVPQGKTYQLMRVRVAPDTDLVPEITGHRLQVGVRFMKADAEGRLRPSATEASFELTLCA